MKKYRYIGTGWYPGVPARDLDQADLDQLTEEQLAAVKRGHLYKAARPVGPDRRHETFLDELDLPSASPEEE